MAVLTLEEYELKRKMKKVGVLKRFRPEEVKGLTKNGGVAILCGDGDIDVRSYHKKAISDRPHCKADFGGPLLFLPSFSGYDPCYAKCMFGNIKAGMGVKQTKTVFCYFHYPCGMAKAYKHSLQDIFRMMVEAAAVLQREGFERVNILFHAKRLNRNKEEEQNTYLVDVNLLRKFIGEGGLA